MRSCLLLDRCDATGTYTRIDAVRRPARPLRANCSEQWDGARGPACEQGACPGFDTAPRSKRTAYTAPFHVRLAPARRHASLGSAHDTHLFTCPCMRGPTGSGESSSPFVRCVRRTRLASPAFWRWSHNADGAAVGALAEAEAAGVCSGGVGGACSGEAQAVQCIRSHAGGRGLEDGGKLILT